MKWSNVSPYLCGLLVLLIVVAVILYFALGCKLNCKKLQENYRNELGQEAAVQRGLVDYVYNPTASPQYRFNPLSPKQPLERGVDLDYPTRILDHPNYKPFDMFGLSWRGTVNGNARSFLPTDDTTKWHLTQAGDLPLARDISEPAYNHGMNSRFVNAADQVNVVRTVPPHNVATPYGN